ncbi:hypothetical protein [Nodosilinea sp. P-1105]|uniref:hypothetical protein n=1 Tax=Nodosilinea sp. P-1105 TaxID=2546229 RepID=UPI001469E76C|nr:hypothetical protein [Nodosilinea sp. P-1105]NMF84814.1 hypothetical protein [Nodosilinea sp. P-1105]
MTLKLDALFDAPGKPYLDTDDLSILSQYISSIPDRTAVYRILRDQEVAIMQPIADALQQVSSQPERVVERSVRNGLMVLRYVAMGMLLDDPTYLASRLQGWMAEIAQAYDTQSLDQQLFQLLQQQLAKVLTPAQCRLLQPGLEAAQALMQADQTVAPSR